jgi:formylglycine-generating enzyme required for sulfatase activity
MLGNVSQWVIDWSSRYAPDGARNPQGRSSGITRVVRGGCHSPAAKLVRVSARERSFFRGCLCQCRFPVCQ